jgi:hypothetical protein
VVVGDHAGREPVFDVVGDANDRLGRFAVEADDPNVDVLQNFEC